MIWQNTLTVGDDAERKVVKGLKKSIHKSSPEKGVLVPFHSANDAEKDTARVLAVMNDMTLAQVLSLRRGLLKCQLGMRQFMALQQNTEEICRLLADEFERAVLAHIRRCTPGTINVITESERKRQAALEGRPPGPTPDFVFDPPIVINDRPVHWLDAKLFYASRVFAETNFMPESKLPEQAKKYISAFGAGAFVIANGFNATLHQLEDILFPGQIQLLDGGCVDRSRLDAAMGNGSNTVEQVKRALVVENAVDTTVDTADVAGTVDAPTPADSLVDAVKSLTLSTATEPEPETFTGVHDALSSFSTLHDLGVYVWHPGSPTRTDLKSHIDVTEQDIRSRLDVTDNPVGIPQLNLAKAKVPVQFTNPKPQYLTNRFPNDPGVAASLAAAAARGMDLGDVDFVFGGSTLNVLSSLATDNKVYLVQRIGKVIAVIKHSEYTSDLSARGFQFKRHVTGERMGARMSEDCVVGMQVARIGSFRVLFHADLDAVDADGTRLEIKSGNPQRFGAKEMFKMVSSRAGSLVYAKCKGNKLVGIERESIAGVAEWVPLSKRVALQTTLLNAMGELKEMVDTIGEDAPSELTFDADGHVALQPRSDVAMLPPRDVVVATTSMRCVV